MYFWKLIFAIGFGSRARLDVVSRAIILFLGIKMPYGRSRGISRQTSRRRNSYFGGVVQRRRKAVAKARLKLAKPVRTLVDRRINLHQEAHSAGLMYPASAWDNAPDNNGRCIPVFPNIASGTTKQNRIGSEVRLTSGWIKGQIYLAPNRTPGNDDWASIKFRLCVLSSKTFRSMEEVINNWSGPGNLFTQLLKGGSTAVPASGDLQSIWTPINTDMFTVHYDKVYTLSRGFGVQYPIPFNPATAELGYHMPAICKSFYIPIKCKNKKVMFSEFTESAASNYAPFLVGWWASSDGSPPTGTAFPAVSFLSHYNYKS